ncbi:AraC family transcriptional regulator [Permianibacter aggregans]|uniref:AraC family transcriptional regulator n=1 Tax=Permianibacter aggregans TaxID=1510150 RepID=A0A4R6UK50_9GAMM|nr:AraC family transcriptional regulator [Permianibacter aggregans]TDQ45839.1 AraC family transcriptional regulator [Permianibacter aggregans]
MTPDAIKNWRNHFMQAIAEPLYIEAMFDAMPDIVFSIKDMDGRYVVISEACVERCGLNHKQQAIGKNAYDLFPAHMADRYNEQDQQVFSSGQALIDSLDLTVFNNREPGWCLTTKYPLRDRDGKMLGLACISKDLIEPSKDGFVDEALSKTVDYVRSQYSETITLDELASIAGLSVAQLDRRIKRIFQITTGQFIIKTRIDAAARMLRDTEKTVADIAMECGFCDQSALTRQFRQVTGLSPRSYRVIVKGLTD